MMNSEHVIQVIADFSELKLEFVCNAVAGSPCRMRPADPGVEEWDSDYEGKLVSSECWAVEWVSAGGWESVIAPHAGVYATIPVSVDYDNGVVVDLIHPQTTLLDVN